MQTPSPQPPPLPEPYPEQQTPQRPQRPLTAKAAALFAVYWPSDRRQLRHRKPPLSPPLPSPPCPPAPEPHYFLQLPLPPPPPLRNNISKTSKTTHRKIRKSFCRRWSPEDRCKSLAVRHRKPPPPHSITLPPSLPSLKPHPRPATTTTTTTL